MYTQLIHSLNENELGQATQVDTISGTYDFESRRYLETIRSNEYLPAQTIFPDLVLYPRAKFRLNKNRKHKAFELVMGHPSTNQRSQMSEPPVYIIDL